MTVLKFEQPQPIKNPPCDPEAEHALLGMVLYNNEIFTDLSDSFAAEHFYEPAHARIFDALSGLISMGLTADPISVGHKLISDDGFNTLGGPRFLADLVDKCPPSTMLRQMAEIISELWRRRELIKLGESIIASSRGGSPAGELIAASETQLTEIQRSTSAIELISNDQAMTRVFAQIDNPALASGIRTGLAPIDDVTGGFMPGEMWIAAGRPGMGKSAVSNTAALNIGMHGWDPSGDRLGVIEIGSEMTVEQMMRRHICDLAYAKYGNDAPSYSKVRKRAITPSQRQMLEEVGREIRKLDTMRSLYRTGLTVPSLRAIIRRQKSAWARKGIKLGLVSIDHMGLVRSSAATRGRTEAQGEVARDTKQLAGELDVAILAIVQLSRKVEERDDKRPMLSDLRDSGEWEENADGVIGFFREAYYAQREPEPKRHDLKILWDERRTSKFVDAIFMKIREGEMQTVKLWADMGRNAIRGEAPPEYYGARGINFPAQVDLLDPGVALPHYQPGEFEA